MSLEIRYLLHGQAEQYTDNQELFIIYKSESCWGKLAKQVLENQSWRLIDSNLTQHISQSKLKSLNVCELTADVVIKLLQKYGVKSINSKQLIEEISQLLIHIGQRYEYKNLWQELPLHKTIEGNFVSITDNTYLDNDNFLLPEELRNTVTFVKQSSNSNLLHQQREWIQEWNASSALKVLLSQSNPYRYDNFIIDILDITLQQYTHQLSNIRRILNDLKETQWLRTQNGNLIAPSQVIYLSNTVLSSEAEKIFNELNEVNEEFITSSMLDSSLQNRRKVLEWLENNLFVRGNKALKIVGEKAGELPHYSLGKFTANKFPLEDAREIFQDISCDILPCWILVKNVDSISDCQQHILPHLLQEIEKKSLIDLLNWISKRYTYSDAKAIKIYNLYLEIAVKYDNFIDEILPYIYLFNRNNSWQTSNKLCQNVGIDNIDEQHILNDQQADVIGTHLINNPIDINEQDEDTINPQEISHNQYEVLKQYFKDWEMHVYSEAIGAFLCLIVGDNQSLKDLAQGYLRRINFDDIYERLVDNAIPRDFHISINSQKTQVLTSLRGQKFTANINSQDRLPKTLFVNQLNSATKQLTLLPINTLQNYNNKQLHNVLKSSVYHLINHVYEVNKQDLRKDIDNTWNDLTKSEQLELKVSRNVILNSAPFVIEMLGVDKKNESVKSIINELNQLEHTLEQYRSSNRHFQQIEQDIFNKKQELGQLLEDETPENQVSSDILQAVREKIKLYGYHVSSIPFEIFQNADDALVELEMMGQNQPLEDSRLQFIIECRQNTITMMHWGRSINCFRHPEHRHHDYSNRGFDRDLQKMLSFNQSNKYHSNDVCDSSNAQVTGKFGLGFKSVYLICQQPRVFSNRIGFKVIGGFLPSNLGYLDYSNLRYQLKQYNQQLSDGTIIKLEIDENIGTSVESVLQDFESFVGLLLIFSRKVKKIQIQIIKDTTQYRNEINWEPQYLLGETSIQVGKIELNKISTHALCLELGNIGTLAITLHETKDGLFASLPKDIPNIWVTAPTQEKLGLKFILNAQFDVNTGRSTLIPSASNDKNLKLAEQLGDLLGKQLCKLFDLVNGNWEKFQELLQLRSNTTPYQFWQLIWDNLAVSWLNKDKQGTLALIQEVLGGDKGMGYFVTHCSCLPNGLWGNYQQLVSPKEVRHIIDGVLKEEKYFTQVFQWSQVQQHCPHNQVIHAKTWDNFKNLINRPLNKKEFPVDTLKLINVLKWQLEDSKADVSTAKEVGEIINKNNFEGLRQIEMSESEEIIDYLSKISFLSKSGKFVRNDNLLVINSQDIEEKLLSAFAPNDYILNSEYTEQGLEFFHACRRNQVSIGKVKIIEWVKLIKLEDTNKQQAVKEYLTYIKLKDNNYFEKLCAELKHIHWLGDWLENIQEPIVPPEVPRSKGEDGKGNPEWGLPGEKLAELFYNEIYKDKENYQLHQRGGTNYNYDYLLCIGEQESKIEVKTISSRAIRFTVSEWNELVNQDNFYELLIVNHNKGDVSRLIRIQNVWNILNNAIKEINLQSLTQETKDVESLIGLQKDSQKNTNIIILNWGRLIDAYKSKTETENINIYRCKARLIEGERRVENFQLSESLKQHQSY